MKCVNILDCTLRDGGRIIDCSFSNDKIKDISRRLSNANIDIVELGFLRDSSLVSYTGNSTFFTDVSQIEPFVNRSQNHTEYVVFVDYGLFDFSTLKPFDGKSIDGIRVGFTKNDFLNHYEDIKKSLLLVKKMGYKLFVQGVNTLGYSEEEYSHLISLVNEVMPYSFGIVDTYGAMYVGDIERIFSKLDVLLNPGICIDFHSHNNFQLSFSFAQEMIKLCTGKRHLILDATLNGMGKLAGNLNTELIVDYLVRILHMDYDFEEILDIIDDHMYSIKKEHEWGYSIPAFMAGIYKSHPNNVIYLTEKYRLQTKEIKYLLSMIDEQKRQRYDYDNIKQLYIEYNHTKVDDKETLSKLRAKFHGKEILVLGPGYSLIEYNKEIESLIIDKNPVIISVNFIYANGKNEARYAFFGSEKRYLKYSDERKNENVIVVSNVSSDTLSDYIVNYESLIDRSSHFFDNTMMMLLQLLRRLGISKMMIGGFDGLSTSKPNYFDENMFEDGRFSKDFERINKEVHSRLIKYAAGLQSPDDIKFITPSIHSNIFENTEN